MANDNQNIEIPKSGSAHTLSVIASHSNINSLLIPNQKSLLDLLPYIDDEIYITITDINIVLKDMECFFKNINKASKELEGPLENRIRGNLKVMNLLAMSIGIEVVVKAICKGIVNSVKNRFTFEQWTAIDEKGGIIIFHVFI